MKQIIIRKSKANFYFGMTMLTIVVIMLICFTRPLNIILGINRFLNPLNFFFLALVFIFSYDIFLKRKQVTYTLNGSIILQDQGFTIEEISSETYPWVNVERITSETFMVGRYSVGFVVLHYSSSNPIPEALQNASKKYYELDPFAPKQAYIAAGAYGLSSNKLKAILETYWVAAKTESPKP